MDYGEEPVIYRPFNNGLYFGYVFENFIGFCFTVGYQTDMKDFQILLQIGSLGLCIGWDQGEEE